MNSIEKALLRQQEQANLNKTANEQDNSDISQRDSIDDIGSLNVIDNSIINEESQDDEIIEADIPSPDRINIDLDKLHKKGFVTSGSSRQIIDEEFRSIKRKILENAFGLISQSLTNPNIIMVTSSRPGEGKTFTAVNLALSIALEQDKTVLLVDADVLRPNVMKTLELKNQVGLMEFLLGEKANLAEVLCRTNVPKLRIIAAGKRHHLSTELLASEKMFHAVEEMANRYRDRVIIIDSPPLLGINETAVLAKLAGQAIVVAEENKTKLADIQKAVSHLNPEMAIGFVVNKAENSGSDNGYGYYYNGDE